MNTYRKISQTAGTLLFIWGILLGLMLLILMVWEDIEAFMFSSNLKADKSLSSLQCPVFMSSKEVGVVKATLENPTEKDWNRFTYVHISDGIINLRRETKLNIIIPAGEQTTVSWELFPENRVYSRFIFFSIYITSLYPYPSLGGSCGVILFDLWDLTGNQILILIVSASLITLTLGYLLWKLSTDSTNDKTWRTFRSMIVLAIIITIGLVIAYLRVWVIGLIFLIVAVLLTGIIIGEKLSSA
jgi:hypothetical protein